MGKNSMDLEYWDRFLARRMFHFYDNNNVNLSKMKTMRGQKQFQVFCIPLKAIRCACYLKKSTPALSRHQFELMEQLLLDCHCRISLPHLAFLKLSDFRLTQMNAIIFLSSQLRHNVVHIFRCISDHIRAKMNSTRETI